MSPRSFLPLLALNALLMLATSAWLLIDHQVPPQLAAHIAFALGVLPLILAAMAYFIPVLTRSQGAGPMGVWPPLLAWAGGVLAVWAFASNFSLAKVHPAATLAGLSALSLLAWTRLRIRRMFGPRHPGLDWYLAALGFLLLALLAILLMPLFPSLRQSLRLFHLHANLLGFIGLTAVGTLQVLLPTCLGRNDPDANSRLRRDIAWAASGALLIAVAAPVSPIFAAAGAVIYLWVLLRMLRAWWRYFGIALLQVHGAAPSLVAATVGLGLLLLLGAIHGVGWIPARPAIAGFVLAFLAPLVSGAAAYLLPVWWRPGIQGEWHQALRRKLSRWAGGRGLFLMLAGIALALH